METSTWINLIIYLVGMVITGATVLWGVIQYTNKHVGTLWKKLDLIREHEKAEREKLKLEIGRDYMRKDVHSEIEKGNTIKIESMAQTLTRCFTDLNAQIEHLRNDIKSLLKER